MSEVFLPYTGLWAIIPATNVAMTYPNKKPPVGPISLEIPPVPPEKIGRPRAPATKNKAVAIVPQTGPSIRPVSTVSMF